MVTLASITDKANELTERISSYLGESTGIEGSTNKTIKDAQEALEIPYAVIKEILPYENYDSETQMFTNTNSVGFAYNVAPRTGADDTLVKSLAELIKNKLPAGWDCQGALYKHSMIGGKIESLYKPFIEKGGLFKKTAQMAIKYHLNASQNGYKNNRRYDCRLSDYRVYLSISHAKSKSDNFEEELIVRGDIEAELMAAQFTYERLTDKELVMYTNSLVSHIENAATWDEGSIEEYKPLSHAIPKRGTKLIVDDNAIQSSVYDEDGNKNNTTIVNLIIKKWPDYFTLWQSADSYVNIFHPEKGIQCSFLLTFNIRALSHEKQKGNIARKSKSLDARNNQVHRKLCPGIEDEAIDCDFVHKNMVKDIITLCDVSFNLTLFSKPENVRKDMAAATSTFRQNGIELMPAYGTQWLSFLSNLPFFMSEGLYESLNMLDQVKQITNWNAVNLLPLIAEFKGSNEGLILPTLRNQLAAIDFHDDTNLPITNKNNAIKAAPGAGKSQLANNIVSLEMAQGNKVFIIDIGESFKHLASIYDATYIEMDNLHLNPFTLFDFEGSSVVKNKDGELIEVDSSEQIRDLLSLMASPDQPLEPIQNVWLLTAVNKTWQKKNRDACIDDVINELNTLYETKHQGDIRLKDVITLLEVYATEGEYGEMFNSKMPLFNNNQMVVLELGKLEVENPQLLRIVLYALIVVIQGQFYNTPRSIRKRCIIDEAWQFLGKGSNPMAAQFIEKGFRTARKHNGGFTVIGHKLDELKTSDTGRAIEACCDINIIMRQTGVDDYVARHPGEFDDFQVEMIKKFGEAKSNGFSEMMIKFGNSVSFHRLFNDPFSRILYSTSGEEFQDVEDLIKQGYSTEAAVEQVAMKYYGDEL